MIEPALIAPRVRLNPYLLQGSDRIASFRWIAVGIISLGGIIALMVFV